MTRWQLAQIMAMETNNVISLYIYYRQLLQRKDRQNMSDFVIYFNISGEFDNVEDWAAA